MYAKSTHFAQNVLYNISFKNLFGYQFDKVRKAQQLNIRGYARRFETLLQIENTISQKKTFNLFMHFIGIKDKITIKRTILYLVGCLFSKAVQYKMETNNLIQFSKSKAKRK